MVRCGDELYYGSMDERFVIRMQVKSKKTVGDLEIDYDRRQVAVGNQTVHVTQTEFNILSLLSQQVGKVMTYSAIINSIWGTMDDGSVKKLQVNMANIRKKLGCKPGENKYIVNELGVGYRMLDPQECSSPHLSRKPIIFALNLPPHPYNG